MARYLLLDDTGAFPVDRFGAPLFVASATGESLGVSVHVTGDIYAVHVPRDVVRHVSEHEVAYARNFAKDRTIARAVSLLAHRAHTLFDPADGSELRYDDAGVVARGDRDRPLFPRLDPAVIGVVVDTRADAILLAENRHRRGYYSCIAGYVEHGENLEEAFAREVLEETGYGCQNITYFASQPWAMSGSLMMGFFAERESAPPADETDGELAEIIWATRKDIEQLPLPLPGSLARTLIDTWYRGEHAMRKEGA
ncbi:NAD(+) diphosphatase [Corynebacterium cystitidis]|uniref:NAD(+) diphosphatase n=1 Tax=Corynebacterium cystitidis TaxID=35757 RepID=UPI00211E8E0E|nr:NUDIX domain-containing protein [Corynebacterium cystitidis]